MYKNAFKTFTLLAGLAGLAIAVGGLLGGSTGLIIGLLIGLAIVGFSYWQSDKLALRAARARVVTAAEAPELHQMVAGLAERANLPMPTVAISPSDQPNAFATGRNPQHAVVCVTEGLWRTLPPRRDRGRARSRDDARAPSRHPDRIRRRGDRHRDQLPRPDGDVLGHLRRAVTTTTAAIRSAPCCSRCWRRSPPA